MDVARTDADTATPSQTRDGEGVSAGPPPPEIAVAQRVQHELGGKLQLPARAGVHMAQRVDQQAIAIAVSKHQHGLRLGSTRNQRAWARAVSGTVRRA